MPIYRCKEIVNLADAELDPFGGLTDIETKSNTEAATLFHRQRNETTFAFRMDVLVLSPTGFVVVFQSVARAEVTYAAEGNPPLTNRFRELAKPVVTVDSPLSTILATRPDLVSQERPCRYEMIANDAPGLPRSCLACGDFGPCHKGLTDPLKGTTGD